LELNAEAQRTQRKRRENQAGLTRWFLGFEVGSFWCVAAAGASGYLPGVSGRQWFDWNLRRRRNSAYYLEHIERPLVSVLNLCSQRAGDHRYPDIPWMFSVRTEDLPAGVPSI